jgi:hypothetical protein
VKTYKKNSKFEGVRKLQMKKEAAQRAKDRILKNITKGNPNPPFLTTAK